MTRVKARIHGQPSVDSPPECPPIRPLARPAVRGSDRRSTTSSSSTTKTKDEKCSLASAIFIRGWRCKQQINAKRNDQNDPTELSAWRSVSHTQTHTQIDRSIQIDKWESVKNSSLQRALRTKTSKLRRNQTSSVRD